MKNVKKSFKIATLGCRTNQYESSAYVTQLKKLGYKEAFEEEADICIVNTCTVTHSADQKSFYQIRKLHKENPQAIILVTGCLAEREKEAILKVSSNIQVIPNKEKENLLKSIFPEQDLPEFSMEKFDAHTRAFVKVQDGCNSFCSYCTIPYVRGRSKSRTIPEILKEIQVLIENGYKEIVITGINVGDFDGGKKHFKRLADLICEVDALEGLERLRISSIDPDEVDDELLNAIVYGKHTCPSMHLVLQSGSNSILKRMNRKYSKEDFFNSVKRLQKARDDFTITTDIIVGFPGETEKDFEQTLHVMQEVKFAKVHMFPYSKRPMTRAAKFPDQIPDDVISKRKKIVLDLANKCAFDLRTSYVGRKMKVLLESEDEEKSGHLLGHTENFLSVSVPAKGLRSNDIVDVLITSNESHSLVAKLL